MTPEQQADLILRLCASVNSLSQAVQIMVGAHVVLASRVAELEPKPRTDVPAAFYADLDS